MKIELLNNIHCPRCKSNLTVKEQITDKVEIVKGTLECVNCHSKYKIENGMPFLYIEDEKWVSKSLEAKGWVDLHKSKGIYDQTGVNIDFILPYFKEEPWIKVASMFDICLNMMNLNGSERILDLGAGRSWAAKNFAKKGCYSVAIDVVPDDQIGLGRSKAIMKAANTYYERIIGDNENLPFRDKSFDIVFCAAALHHSSNLRKLLENIYRVLTENGRLIAINEPCIGIFENEHNILKNSEELKYGINETRPNVIQYYEALWKAGFRNIDIFPYQIYKQGDLEIERWATALGINGDNTKMDNFLSELPIVLCRTASKTASKYDILKNNILAQFGGEIIVYAEKVKKMKLAFVVQRYGLEVNGGAELHCRQVAELLSKYFDVDVITTCAIDYMTWKNEYPPGKEVRNGLTIWRFPVDAPRDVPKFNRFSEKIFGKRHTKEDEIMWMKLQGPYSTKLFEFIEKNKEEYDYFIFFTYLYCTTFFGLPKVKDKAILVPTAHDEPPIYLEIFKELFSLPKAIIYNTEEEKRFVNSKFDNAHILSDVVGVGIDTPKDIQPANFRQKYNNYDDFIIYMGRLDESKGCKELFEYFLRYKKEINSNIKLVLIGKPVMKIPKHEDIIPFGFVSEEDKFNGISASELLVMPSVYESLSMVLIEAWMCKKAVLVNGQCEVLKGHCRRSNAGLYYENYDEFEECLNLLLSNGELREKMGENGKKYVEENYSWEKVEEKYLQVLEKLS